MMQMSFSDKIKVLVDVSSSSGICIASIFLLIFMAALFLTTNRKNAKNSKKLYLGIYLVLIIVLVLRYYGSLSSMFDYMMNNFFIVFYFPNLAIYLAAIIITNIILWNTIFNFKEDRLLKYINTTVYTMIHYLLVLLLNVVTTNKLDVFDQSSIYKNSSAAALISLSGTLFIIWIVFIIIYKLIRKNQKKHRKVKIPVRRVIRYKKKLPANFQSIEVPNVVSGRLGNTNNSGVFVDTNLIDFYKQEEKQNLDTYNNLFTLEDYKRVLDILKKDLPTKNDLDIEMPEEESTYTEMKTEKEQNNQTLTTEPVSIEENQEIEQPKLEELLNLYRSV